MKNKAKSGFTLVELIVVIAILGILAVITIPRFSQYVLEAKIQKEITNAETIHRAAIAYIADKKVDNDPSWMITSPTNLYNFEKNESALKPYLSDDIKILAYQWEVNEPGEYAVWEDVHYFKDGSYKRDYVVIYFDPRVNTPGEPYMLKTTAIHEGVPVMLWEGVSYETDANGNPYAKYMTVDEYLEKKAQEDKN